MNKLVSNKPSLAHRMPSRAHWSLRAAWIAGPILALTSSASAGTYRYGTGTTYDRDNGDIVSTPSLTAFSTGIVLANGVLTITGGTANDVASVSLGATRGTIVAKRGSFTETFSTGLVTKIIFYGNAGDDAFTNTTGIPCEAYGGDGNDALNGGSDADFLVGGYGQDTLRGYGGDDVVWGSGGHDMIYGGDGQDHLKGHGGTDQLFGEAGRDALYGGTSNDTLNGGADADTLVTIGGDTDSVTGGTGYDFYWVDTVDTITDESFTESNESYANRVASFYSYSYDGGANTTPVAKDLTSTSLLDPIADEQNVSLVSFADRPLFASGGPSEDDVIQGSIGDCFILGPLSAVASATPDSIRKLVVDLDDGTYAVRFFRTDGGAPQYVRVDADLWVRDATTVITYARLGVEGSIWAPIVEKAFAWFRDREGSYASISGGNSGTSGTVIMGADNTEVYEIGGYEAQSIVNWVAAGRPAGAIANHVNASVPVLLNWIIDRQAEGRPVYTGIVSGADNATVLIAPTDTVDGTWRRGQHIVMVDRVTFDANGIPNGLVLRDQIGGVDRVFTDVARIYFLIGRARMYDMP